MIECSECGAKYPTERMFCGKCKERLGVRCPVCGFINLLDDLFCGICLTELSAPTKIPAGQKSEEPGSSGSSLYELPSARRGFASIRPAVSPDEDGASLWEEIRVGAEEDEDFAVADEKIAQEEIDEIFQGDEE